MSFKVEAIKQQLSGRKVKNTYKHTLHTSQPVNVYYVNKRVIFQSLGHKPQLGYSLIRRRFHIK